MNQNLKIQMLSGQDFTSNQKSNLDSFQLIESSKHISNFTPRFLNVDSDYRLNVKKLSSESLQKSKEPIEIAQVASEKISSKSFKTRRRTHVSGRWRKISQKQRVIPLSEQLAAEFVEKAISDAVKTQNLNLNDNLSATMTQESKQYKDEGISKHHDDLGRVFESPPENLQSINDDSGPLPEVKVMQQNFRMNTDTSNQTFEDIKAAALQLVVNVTGDLESLKSASPLEFQIERKLNKRKIFKMQNRIQHLERKLHKMWGLVKQNYDTQTGDNVDGTISSVQSQQINEEFNREKPPSCQTSSENQFSAEIAAENAVASDSEESKVSLTYFNPYDDAYYEWRQHKRNLTHYNKSERTISLNKKPTLHILKPKFTKVSSKLKLIKRGAFFA